MSLIEEAAKRLRQLQEAGVGVGGHGESNLASLRRERAEPRVRAAEPNPAQFLSLDLARLQAEDQRISQERQSRPAEGESPSGGR